MKEWLEHYRRLRYSSKMRVLMIAKSSIDSVTEPDKHQANNDKLETEMLADTISLTDKNNEVEFVTQWLTSFVYCQELLDHVGVYKKV